MRSRSSHPRSTGSGARVRGGDIGYLLKQLNSAFRRRLDERLRHRELDLSMAHMAALFTLQDEPGLAGAQLARRTMTSAQSMNSVLRRLERDGLIGRQQHPENRHTDCWNLTAAGSQRLTRAHRVVKPVLQEMLAALSAAERAELQRLLARCVNALEMADATAVRRGASATRAGKHARSDQLTR
jgi:DNA-binding MarR family transcriptional regulator